REVVSETAQQARDLLGEASGHARDQASVQQQKAASQLRSVADELREMTVKGGQSGVATEVAQQAAERIHGMASWLEQREPSSRGAAVTGAGVMRKAAARAALRRPTGPGSRRDAAGPGPAGQ